MVSVWNPATQSLQPAGPGARLFMDPMSGRIAVAPLDYSGPGYTVSLAGNLVPNNIVAGVLTSDLLASQYAPAPPLAPPVPQLAAPSPIPGLTGPALLTPGLFAPAAPSSPSPSSAPPPPPRETSMAAGYKSLGSFYDETLSGGLGKTPPLLAADGAGGSPAASFEWSPPSFSPPGEELPPGVAVPMARPEVSTLTLALVAVGLWLVLR